MFVSVFVVMRSVDCRVAADHQLGSRAGWLREGLISICICVCICICGDVELLPMVIAGWLREGLICPIGSTATKNPPLRDQKKERGGWGASLRKESLDSKHN